jgi:Helix-turn-helix domain
MKNLDAKTQRNLVLSWLEQKPLSTLEARQDLYIMSIAARIFELKRLGYKIITKKVKAGTKQIAEYVLIVGDQT